MPTIEIYDQSLDFARIFAALPNAQLALLRMTSTCSLSSVFQNSNGLFMASLWDGKDVHLQFRIDDSGMPHMGSIRLPCSCDCGNPGCYHPDIVIYKLAQLRGQFRVPGGPSVNAATRLSPEATALIKELTAHQKPQRASPSLADQEWSTEYSLLYLLSYNAITLGVSKQLKRGGFSKRIDETATTWAQLLENRSNRLSYGYSQRAYDVTPEDRRIVRQLYLDGTEFPFENSLPLSSIADPETFFTATAATGRLLYKTDDNNGAPPFSRATPPRATDLGIIG